MPNENETSLRDDIQAAVTELTPAEPTTPEPAPAPEPVAAAEPEETSAEPAPAREDGRDEKGRFAPKKAAAPVGAADAVAGAKPAETTAPPAAPTGQPVPAEEPKPAPVVEKAPQSWRPLARESWAQLPQEVRAEVVRREQEVSRVLQESARARRDSEAFNQAIQPYEGHLRASGLEPARAVAGLLQTEYALRTAPPAQKAQVVANMIRGYGVSIEALDAILSGQPAPGGHQQPAHDPRVDQLVQRLEAQERARQAAVMESARASIEEFASDKDFYEDVREEMADVLEMATRRGQKMTLAEAYERAIALRPDVQKVVQQREAAAAAAKAQASTQRSRVAASSIESKPAVAPPRSSDGTSLRDDILAAAQELRGRA